MLAAPSVLRRDALVPLTVVLEAGGEDEAKAPTALKRIGEPWDNAYAAPLLDLFPFVSPGRVRRAVVAQLENESTRAYGEDLNHCYAWLWSFDPGVHPEYAEFKAALYCQIDPRFREHFAKHPKAMIRLDEIRWGGVLRNRIPPQRGVGAWITGRPGRVGGNCEQLHRPDPCRTNTTPSVAATLRK